MSSGLWCWYLSVMLFILQGCSASQNASRPSTPSEQTAQQNINQRLSSEPNQPVNPLIIGLTGGVPRGEEAWQRFTADGRYRVARAEDFIIPDAARREGGEYLQRMLEFPFIAGDVNRDGPSRDCAVIVVDTTRSDAERFGLVIFNAPEDDNTIPQPHWLYRERDLSRTVLGWDSEGLNLRTYRDDSTFALCRVRWDERRQRYFCN